VLVMLTSSAEPAVSPLINELQRMQLQSRETLTCFASSRSFLLLPPLLLPKHHHLHAAQAAAGAALASSINH